MKTVKLQGLDVSDFDDTVPLKMHDKEFKRLRDAFASQL
jgi:hypothetical protein